MKTNKIINRPPDEKQYGYGLNDCHTNIWNKDMILYRFYNQGVNKTNYISYDLEQINWVPEDNKKYKCWWYSTNPADPADPGNDVLLYVEEWNSYMDKPILRQSIIDKLYNFTGDQLLKVQNILKNI